MTRTLSVRAVSALVVGGLSASILYATIPDSAGVIHACYTKSTGTIRVIDSSVTSMKQGETSIV